jgi:hypothetical protein
MVGGRPLNYALGPLSTSRISLAALYASIILIAGCTSTSAIHGPMSWHAAETLYTSICALKKDQSAFVGQVIRIRGALQIAMPHGGHFWDATCGEDGWVSYVSGTHSTGDETVSAMYKDIWRHCRIPCMASIELEGSAKVLITDGHPVLDLQHIEQYQSTSGK